MNVLATVRDVAGELGEDWVAAAGNWDDSVFLHGPDNVSLFVHLGYYGSKAGRLVIGINYGDAQDHVPNTGSVDCDPHKVITVSPKKTREQIARDITRRLLPDAIPATALARERKLAWDQQESARREQQSRIAAIWNTQPRPDSEWIFGPYGVQMQVRQKSVYIESHLLPYEAAEKIAIILAEHAGRTSAIDPDA